MIYSMCQLIFVIADDLMKANGEQASDVISFGNSWLAYENGTQVGS